MEKPIMDIHQVLKCLPHRFPFLLIDRVLEIEPGKSLTALKNVTSNESYFMGHFPERPVMPGVLMLEAMAQAACILAYKSTAERANDNSLYLFAGIDKARFKHVVEPGDQLILQVEVLKARKGLMKVLGTAKVDGRVACIAELMSVKKDMSE